MLIIIASLILDVYANYRAKLESNTTYQTIYSLTKNNKMSSTIESKDFELEDALILEITHHSLSEIDIKIYDKAQKHYRIPNTPVILQYIKPFDFNEDIKNEIANCIVTVIENPFSLTITRKQEVIFKIENLKFSDLYIEFTHWTPSKHIFGLGERNQKGFRFKEGIYTLMARDAPKLMEDGKLPGKHVYSSQPVLLQREKQGFDLFFYKTASPMDVIYSDQQMTFITIGGIIDIRLFLGQTPQDCIKQYHQYLKGWLIPPFWSLGFHQSRWGYKTSKVLLEVINNYKKNDIPIDVIWSDLDYMNDRQIFSVDFGNFTKSDYQKIKESVKYIPLLDVAVGVKYPNDPAYVKGLNDGIFCYSPTSGTRFQGYVWPGDSHFPDFFHPNITFYWVSMMKHLHDQVAFDGIWLDMNEPANFCDGECTQKPRTNDPVHQEYLNGKINLLYTPGHEELDSKTLPPHLKHFGNITHKDVHNIYGIMASYNTYLGQKTLNQMMSFQIVRSTFPGSGRYAQHWFGDNSATWDMMYLSLGQIFQFQIFGIPMTGADVCGFMDDTNEKLCSRWIQLATIYPFFRNHNNDLAISQEFYVLGDTVLQSAQKNLNLRYSLLKWMYMLYFRANHTGTSTYFINLVINPLFFIYPTDKLTYEDMVLDTEAILGEEILAAPLLQEGVTRHVYFPEDDWYDLLTGLVMKKGSQLVFCSYNSYIPLYLRNGYLVVQQTQEKYTNTKELTNKYRIIAAFKNNVSKGNFLDLDNFNDEINASSAQLLNITISITKNNINIRVERNDKQPMQSTIIIESIKLYGIDEVKCQNCQISSGNYLGNTIVNKELVFDKNQNLYLLE